MVKLVLTQEWNKMSLKSDKVELFFLENQE